MAVPKLAMLLLCGSVLIGGCTRHHTRFSTGAALPAGSINVKCENFEEASPATAARIAEWYAKGWRIAYTMTQDKVHYHPLGANGSSASTVCFGHPPSQAAAR